MQPQTFAKVMASDAVHGQLIHQNCNLLNSLMPDDQNSALCASTSLAYVVHAFRSNNLTNEATKTYQSEIIFELNSWLKKNYGIDSRFGLSPDASLQALRHLREFYILPIFESLYIPSNNSTGLAEYHLELEANQILLVHIKMGENYSHVATVISTNRAKKTINYIDPLEPDIIKQAPYFASISKETGLPTIHINYKVETREYSSREIISLLYLTANKPFSRETP